MRYWNYKFTLASSIKEYMERLNIRQVEICNKTGIEKYNLSKMLSSTVKSHIHTDVFYIICYAIVDIIIERNIDFIELDRRETFLKVTSDINRIFYDKLKITKDI